MRYIRHAFVAGRGVYGSPRIHAYLRHQGIRCGRKRVVRLMRAQRAVCRTSVGGASPARPTASTHARSPPICCARNFTATAPNRKWVADITGIETSEGWLYLAGIVDTYSRRAIGYAMDTSGMRRWSRPRWRWRSASRRPQAGLVHHSDRGSQYTRWGYRAILESQGIVLSMSGKGDPYDNALMESFFATLKAECVERHEFQTSDRRAPASLSTWRSSTTGSACIPPWAIAHRWPSSSCRSIPDALFLHEIGATPLIMIVSN